MERYKYKAINASGRPIRGILSANGEVDLYEQLQKTGLELLDCKVMNEKKSFGLSLSAQRITIRDLIQFFLHMEQMQTSGVALLDALSDIRDTSDNSNLRDILSDIYRSVSEGAAMSEAMEQHPKVFKNLYISLIKAGEDTGDLTSSYRQLIEYLKWLDRMQSRIRKATRYPAIILVVVLLTVVVMMGVVVPQIAGFIQNLEQELPFYTKALIATSEFVKVFWWAILATPVLLTFMAGSLHKSSHYFAYRLDAFFLNAPIAGPILRKVAIARYAQTFSALYTSGIDVINALKSARRTTNNLVLIDAFKNVEQAVSTGKQLSAAFEESGEFPSMVVRMLKVGEESGNLTVVLNQVTEFYTQDVDESVEGLISMVEPMLTAVLGIVILWIALAVFGPIYSSFENIF